MATLELDEAAGGREESKPFTGIVPRVTAELELVSVHSIEERLAQLEAVVDRGIRTFVEVGQALTEIRDMRLYKQNGHATFEDYCRIRWNFARSTAYGYITAARVAENVRTCGQSLPSQRHAELLSGLDPIAQRKLAPTIAPVSVSEAKKIVSRFKTHQDIEKQRTTARAATGQAPDPPPPAYVADTPQKRKIAENQLRRLSEALGYVHGFASMTRKAEGVDLGKVAAVSTAESLLDLAAQLEADAQELLDFAQDITVAAEQAATQPRP